MSGYFRQLDIGRTHGPWYSGMGVLKVDALEHWGATLKIRVRIISRMLWGDVSRCTLLQGSGIPGWIKTDFLFFIFFTQFGIKLFLC